MRLRKPRRLGLAIFVLAASTIVLGFGGGLTFHYLDARERPARAAHLASALEIGPGSTVAEIGAGAGAMAVEMARIVGPTGRVLATEVQESQLDDIRRAAQGAGLKNVTVLQAGEHDSNLPAGCCDAVYMQRVYHHLTDPSPVIASIAKALKPGGRLAVLDFEPGWIANMTTPPGVPNRGGHGVPKEMLLREMKGYGFRAVGPIEDFGDELYLAVFERG